MALEYKEHNADEAECSEKIDEQMEIPFDWWLLLKCFEPCLQDFVYKKM